MSDYCAFGMAMPGRSYQSTSSSYRYGYQGSEKDDEVSGAGNSYTTFYRQLDPRIGRWLSVDPMTSAMPWQTPYNSMDNNPISFNDPLGDWVKGAGLKNNLTKTDRQNDAEMFAKETGGNITHNVKNDTYTVDYVSGSHDYVDSDGQTNVIINTSSKTFDSKGAFEQISEGLGRIPGAIRSFEKGINDYMKTDPTGLGKINTKEGSTVHNIAKGVAGLNPLWSVPNAISVLTIEEDFYGDKADSKLDKGLAVFSIIAPMNPGAGTSKALLNKQTVGKVADGVNTAVQFANDAGLLNDLKKSDNAK